MRPLLKNNPMPTAGPRNTYKNAPEGNGGSFGAGGNDVAMAESLPTPPFTLAASKELKDTVR